MSELRPWAVATGSAGHDIAASQPEPGAGPPAPSPSAPRESAGGILAGLTELHHPLPQGVIATGAPRLATQLPTRPPGQLSLASTRQDIFQGTGLTVAAADRLVLPHVLHHMTDRSNDTAIAEKGFDHSKAKEDPENRFAFDPAGATEDELKRHKSRSRSVFFGLGEEDRGYMAAVKRDDKEVYEVDTSIHHAMIPSRFHERLVQDECNPPARNYHRFEGSVPAACLLAEPVESRSLAREAIGERIREAGFIDVSQAQLNAYMRYMIEKFDHEERFETTGARNVDS